MTRSLDDFLVLVVLFKTPVDNFKDKVRQRGSDKGDKEYPGQLNEVSASVSKSLIVLEWRSCLSELEIWVAWY